VVDITERGIFSSFLAYLIEGHESLCMASVRRLSVHPSGVNFFL